MSNKKDLDSNSKAMVGTANSGIRSLILGFGAGLFLFGLTLCTLGIFLLPTLASEWNVASGPGEYWSPPTTPTSTPSPGPVPTRILSPTLMPTASTSAPATFTFEIGDRAVNAHAGTVNLRKTPGYIGKTPSDRVALIPNGGVVIIVAGPEQEDELIWWFVSWKDKEGWMAERRSSGGAILELAEQN
ncbi:MAG: hypothetical protein GY762_19895 [Proteobacteria bacterium]|nr:hypothetical protein [Pseudomonadota bacterium]